MINDNGNRESITMGKFKDVTCTTDKSSFEELFEMVSYQCKKQGTKLSRQERRQMARELSKESQGRIYINEKYQVQVRYDVDDAYVPDPDTVSIHLSIKRIDNGTCLDWAELQQIKDELISPDFECVMVFPSHRRVVDAANQYHLWGLMDREGFTGLDQFTTAYPVPYGWGLGKNV